MRPERDAVVGDDRHRLRLLQGSERVVALPDPCRDRVAEIPLAVFLTVVLARETLALPATRRKHARQFAFDVDTGFLSVAELRQERVRIVDVRFAGEHVVIRVAGNDDRFGDVDSAVAARFVVAESMCRAGYLIEAGVEDRLRRGALAGAERRKREKRLDRRSGRVRAAQRAVEQRLVRRVVEQLPVGGIDTVDKKIRVEAGLGDECENIARRRLDGHKRTSVVAERRFCRLLQAYVERQLDVIAGSRRRARQGADRAAAGVDFDLLDACRSVQLALVGKLYAHLADVVRAFVIRRFFPLVDALEVVIVDAADIADDVRRDFSERILAEQSRLDLDAGKPVAVHREARDLLVG